MFQVKSIKTYFFKFSNWIDFALIALSWFVLYDDCFVFRETYFKETRALTILVMVTQFFQLATNVSALSMSLHVAIFKKVCSSFLKTMALYFILVLAFAMSFYTLKDDVVLEGTENGFSSPFVAIVTAIRMMLGDFGKIETLKEDYFEGLMFLMFIVLVTVVLFNLLNALAISDTNEIIKDAGLVDTRRRISILSRYVRFFNAINLKFANVFPMLSSISIFPNKDENIRVKRPYHHFDNKDAEKMLTEKYENVFEVDSLMTLEAETVDKILVFLKNQT